ncbi:MAG: TonB-dependent receptor, partial [Xanthomonadales bacterium]|nr:TonB-dependent receptor [Xanthomonadales bacterium]
MFKMNRNLLSVALASAILALAQSAQAQADQVVTDQTDQSEADDDTPEILDAIQATGIRASIESAIAVKQEATSVVEVVTAEDIGKLPDVSIAESIARLPGLTAQRVAGRAQTISIRGLAGDFATTLLNGREQVSTGDNRGVEFDQYPSELLNAVVVYKTQDASLIGQGLSGTVDLRTVRPLSFDEPVLAVNLRGEKNSLGELNADSDDYGYRFSGSYIDQFADDTIGIALGYARLDSPGQARRWGAWGYPTATINGIDNVSLLGGSESWATSTDNVRDGLMGVLEYRPNDNYASVLDVYYSQFEKAETTRALQVGLGWSGATLTNPVVENGRLVDATWVGVRPVIRNDQNDREDDIFAIGWNNEWKLSDDWSATVDLSYSKADREESILETYAGSLSTDTVHIDSRSTPPTLSFGLDYTDPASIVLTDPGGWGQNGYIKYPEVEDTLKSFRASAERAFEDGHFSSLEFGINYADRQKSRFVAESFLDLISDPTQLTPGLLTDPANLSFSGIPGVIAYDVNAAFNQFYAPRTNVNPDILNKAWEVNEEVLTGYLQANIDTVWGDIPVRGNLGVQVIRHRH